MAPLRTYFSENFIKVQPFSLKKMHVKMSSAKWRPSCLSFNVLFKSLTPCERDHHRSTVECRLFGIKPLHEPASAGLLSI